MRDGDDVPGIARERACFGSQGVVGEMVDDHLQELVGEGIRKVGRRWFLKVNHRI